jgi:hypothetical protein
MEEKFQHVYDNGNIWVIVSVHRGVIQDVLAFCTEEDAETVLAEMKLDSHSDDELELHNVDLRTNVR